MATTTDEGIGEITRSVCEAVVNVRLDAVPERTVTRAKYLVLDGIACGLVGARLPWSDIAVSTFKELEGSGPCQVWGWGDLHLPLGAASLLNGTFVQGFELDDYHEVGPLHSESVVLPSVFGTAEQLGTTDGAQALLAIVLGLEFGPRLGIAMDGHQMLVDGWHCGAIYGTPTAALAAGVLRKLDVDQMEDALGIGATQASGLMAAQFEAMVKRMHHGFAARAGTEAAALAASGFSGIKGVLERPYGGLFATFAPDRIDRLTRLLDGWGADWELERINVKPYAAQGGLHSTIDAMLDFRNLDDVAASDIEQVRIFTPINVYKHAGWQLERPAETVGAQMNIGYAAAVAMLDGEALIEQFASARINADDVWDLMEKVHVSHRPEMDGSDAKLAVQVEVDCTDGRTLTRTVNYPRGSGGNLLTNQEIEAKYRSLMRTVCDDTMANEVAESVMSLEESGRFERLLELLSGPVRAPF